MTCSDLPLSQQLADIAPDGNSKQIHCLFLQSVPSNIGPVFMSIVAQHTHIRRLSPIGAGRLLAPKIAVANVY